MVEALQKIDKQAHGLITLITAILDIAQMDSGTFELHQQRFDFTRLLDEACDGMPQLLGDKPVVFEAEYDRNPNLVASDRERVKQVLGYLLDNAAKFTRQGKILLRATAVEGGLEMVVEDTGIGIDPENQKIIFDGFRQVEEEDNRRYEGLGVGLYLSRRILELLGGTIEVESQAGEGSRFRVWIPSPRLAEAV
jgi:signal transduction histidine kinase